MLVSFHIKSFLHISDDFVHLLVLEYEINGFLETLNMCVVFTEGDAAGLFPYETFKLVSSSFLSWTDQISQSSCNLLNERYILACQGLEAE